MNPSIRIALAAVVSACGAPWQPQAAEVDSPPPTSPPPMTYADVPGWWTIGDRSTAGGCGAQPLQPIVDADGFAQPNWRTDSVSGPYGTHPQLLGYAEAPHTFLVEERTEYACYGVNGEGGRCSGLHVVDLRCPGEPATSWSTGYLRMAAVDGRKVTAWAWPFEYGEPALFVFDRAEPLQPPVRIDHGALARALGWTPLELTAAHRATLGGGRDQTWLVFAKGSRVVLAALSASNSYAWHRDWEGVLIGSPVADEGRVYVPIGVSEAVAEADLHAVDAAGAVLWDLPIHARVAAVFGSSIVLQDGTVIRASDGTIESTWPPGVEVVLSDRIAVLRRPCGPECTIVEQVDRSTGAMRPSVEVHLDVTDLFLGDRGDVLIGGGRAYWADNPFSIQYGYQVFEVGPWGGTRQILEYLPPKSHEILDALLLDDHLVVVEQGYPHNQIGGPPELQLVGFALPGRRPERVGWLHADGNFGRAFAPNRPD